MAKSAVVRNFTYKVCRALRNSGYFTIKQIYAATNELYLYTVHKDLKNIKF